MLASKDVLDVQEASGPQHTLNPTAELDKITRIADGFEEENNVKRAIRERKHVVITLNDVKAACEPLFADQCRGRRRLTSRQRDADDLQVRDFASDVDARAADPAAGVQHALTGAEASRLREPKVRLA